MYQESNGNNRPEPANSAVDVGKLPVYDAASLEDAPTSTAFSDPLPTRKHRLRLLHYNRSALIATVVAVLVIVSFGLGTLALSGFRSNSGSAADQKASDKYSSKNLSVSTVSSDDAAQLGQADKVALNGQLEINKTLVIAPSSAPNAPTTGQLYFDKTSSTLKYYNGTAFVSLGNDKTVTTLGGISGDVALSGDFLLNGNQLSLAPGVKQTATVGVTSFQGQTGPVTLTAGTGVSVNGTTIANSGVLSIAGGNGLQVSGPTGSVTISLPQGLGTSSTPTFGGLQLTAALGVASGGTGLNAVTSNQILLGGAGNTITQLTNAVAGQCLVSNGVGAAPSFQACSGAGGVSTINGQNGAVTIANATAAAGTITLNDAKADGTTKGLAAFNATNFTAAAGVINTVQDISTGGSPSFASISLSTALTVGNGGTGSTTAAGARTNLGAAASGANSDITSLSGLTTALSVGQGGTGATTAAGARTNLGAAASGVNSDITQLSGLTTALSVSQGGTGLATVTANQILIGGASNTITQLSNGSSGDCLVSNGAGSAPSFQACTGAGGVSSIDSLTGAISLANSTGAAGTITIDNAKADGSTKGIAAFNSTNFTATNGVIDTIQGIATTSTPTFASLTLTSALSVVNGGTGSTSAGGARTNLGAAASGANSDITQLTGLTTALSVSQGGTGLATITANQILIGGASNTVTQLSNGSSGDCLVSNGAGSAPSFQACTGSGGVASVDSLTGALTLANSSGSVNTITIDNAAADGSTKGIAAFVSTNFSASSGIISIKSGGITTTEIADGTITATDIANSTITGANIANTTVANGNLVNSSLGITAGSGLSGGSASISLGSSTSLSVVYGSSAGSAVQGNVTLTCPAGTGNLTGGGNTITLGTGGSCSAIDITGSPVFAGTVDVQGSGGLTVGKNSVAGVINISDGAASKHVASISVGTLSSDQSYALPTTGGTICVLEAGNCTGANGGGITGSGTTSQNFVPKFSNAGGTTVTNSSIYNDATGVSIGGSSPAALFNVGATNEFQVSTSGALTSVGVNSGSGLIQGTGGLTVGSTVKFSSLTSAGGQCLTTDGTGTLSLVTCLSGAGGGAGGVASLNGLSGTLSIANASGSGATVTIDDAKADGSTKGIAAFNSTNFTAASGVINTAQNINSTATPTFGGLTLSTALSVGNGGTGSTNASGARSNLGAAASGANSDITSLTGLTTALSVSQGGTGLNTVTANQILIGGASNTITQLSNGTSGDCLVSNGAGSAPTFQACTGSGGVGSIDGLTGTITLANSTGAAGTITIDNAAADGTTKGIAAFDSTNFTASAGVINTIQGIATTSTPTFGGLTLSSALTVGNGGTGSTSAGGARTNLGAAASGANSDITSLTGLTTALSVSQGGTGLNTVTANQLIVGGASNTVTQIANGSSGDCLISNGAGSAPSFQACTGAGGVSAIDGLTGSITLANSTGAAGTITINDAKADGATKGIAAFNGTNFSAAAGVINTTQDINSSATPTFGGLTLGTALSIGNGGTGSTTAAGARTNLGVAASGANSDITSLTGLTTALSVSQGGTGLNTVTANQILIGGASNTITQLANASSGDCLVSNGAGSAPTFQACTGAGGVSSVDGLSGTITLANSSGAAGTITIDDAKADGSTKGIAAFNSTNFTASAGIINTIQGIASTSTPSFAGLTLTGGANVTTISASGQFTSTVTTGTAPLVVASTTKVVNFNADLLDGLDSTAFAAGSGSGNYIQNQNASQQASSNFWISGTGRADTSLLTNLLDGTTAGSTLAIGTTNATGGINLNQNTTLAAGKTIKITGDTYANIALIGSPTEGMTTYDTTNKQFLTYQSGKWKASSQDAIIVAANNSSQADKNAADYVATGTADQGVINTALTAADPAGAGRLTGKVILLAGTYNTTNVISVPNNVTLAGEGAGTLLKLSNVGSANRNMITNTTTGGSGTGVVIRDLALDGNSGVNTGTDYGILFNGMGANATTGGMILNVFVSNMADDGIHLTSSFNSTLNGNIVSSNGNNGIFVNGSKINLVNNLTNSNTTYGITLSASSYDNATGNNVNSNKSGGILLSSNASDGVISANTVENNGGAGNDEGIVISSSSGDNIISNNHIDDTACSSTCYAIDLTATAGTRNYLSGNTFDTSPLESINDSASGTIYGGQLNGSSVYVVQAASGIQLTGPTTVTGNLTQSGGAISLQANAASVINTSTGNLSLDAAGTLQLGIGTTGAVTIGKTGITTTIQGSTSVTLQTSTSTTVVCSNSGVLSSCDTSVLAPTATNFIQNQNSTTQTGTFKINGTGTLGTIQIATTGSLDASAAGVINIGLTSGGNGTSISLNQSVNLASGANFAQAGAGTFSTGTGTISLNGSTILAAGKTITVTGDTYANIALIGSPTEGMTTYDTTNKQFLTYQNGKWKASSQAAIIVAANNSSQADKNAADYVATGTSDQTIINTALTAADPAGSGRKTGKVILLAGTYTTSDVISVPNNTTLAGQGSGTLVQFGNLSGASKNLITNTTTGGSGTGIVIRDLAIDGLKATNSGGTDNGVFMNGAGSTTAPGSTITNVTASNFNNFGIYLSSTQGSTVVSNTTYNNVVGIYITGNRNNINNNITFGNSTYGIVLNGSLYDVVDGNNVYTNTSGGILLNGNSSDDTITGNDVYNNGGSTTDEGIIVTNSNDTLIASNHILDGGGSTCTTNCYAIDINGTSTRTVLNGNTFGNSPAQTINDTGTNTMYNGQIKDSSNNNFYIQPAGSIQLTGPTTVTGNLTQSGGAISLQANAASVINTSTGNLSLDAAGTLQLGIGTTGAVTIGKTGITTTIQGSTSVTLQTSTSTTVVCSNSGVLSSCDTSVLAPTATNFIQNQNSTTQTGTFKINGTGTAGNLLVSGSNGLDTASAISLNIGLNNASGVTITPATSFSNNVTIATGKTFTTNGSGFDASGKLGVGTTGPSYSLDVQGGDINASGYIRQAGQIVIDTTHGTNSYFLFTAGNATTTGSSNLGAGNNSLGHISSGSNNIGIGNNTLNGDTTGAGNVGVGQNNFENNAVGNNNTALGAFAGQSHHCAPVDGGVGCDINNETLIGYHTGYLLQQGGDGNTLLGYLAGNNLTTGANNIIIGQSATATSATVSNQLNIGNTLYGDLANGRVGIGTSSTGTYALNVNGDTNTSGVYRVAGTSGATTTCSGGQVLQNQVVVGGIVTGGSCIANGGGAGSYVTLQGSTPGTADVGSFNINGTGIAAVLQGSTKVNTPLLDTASAGSLSIGTGTATNITLGQSGVGTTVAGTLTVSQDATFNGNITVAAGKSITITGSGSRPGSPTEGMLYYDTTEKQLLVYANSKWQADRSTATKIVTDGSTTQNPESGDFMVPAANTSAQTTINNAIAALPSGGGTVYLREGTYTISGAISLPSNVKLVGTGDSTIIKIASGTSTTIQAIVNSNTSTGNTNITVSSLLLNGNNAGVTGTQQAIKFTKVGSGSGGSAVNGSRIEDVSIVNFTDDEISLITSNNNVVTNVSISSGNGNGITLNGSSYNTVTNANIAGIAKGILLTGASYNNISGNNVTGNGNIGFSLLSSSNNNQLTGNVSSGNTQGFVVNNSLQNTLSANTSTANSGTGFTLTSGAESNTLNGNQSYNNGGAGYVTSGTSPRNVLSNNVSKTNTGAGFSLGADSATVLGNLSASNTTYGIYVDSANDIVSNNKVYDNGGSGGNSGINLTTNAVGDSVMNNNITDTAGTGHAINIVATASGNTLSGNTFSGTGAADIADAGTGTIYGGQLNNSSIFTIQDATGIQITGPSTITGSLTQTGGAVSLTGNAASTISTTSGTLGVQGAGAVSISTTAISGGSSAITILSGNASAGTAGNVTVDTGTNFSGSSSVNIGNTNATVVNIGTGASGSSVNIGNNLLFVDGTGSKVGIGGSVAGTKLAVTAALGLNVITGNTPGTGKLLVLQNSGTSVVEVANSGALSVNTSAASVSDFQVASVTGSILLNADETNGYVIDSGTRNADNLIQNPGFESTATFSASGWGLTANGTNSAANPHTGAQNLQLAPTGASYTIANTQYYAVTPGDTYYIEAWTKADAGVDGAGAVGINFFNASKTFTSASTVASNDTTSYALVSNTFTVPAGSFFLKAIGKTSATTGKRYMDDFYMARVTRQQAINVGGLITGNAGLAITGAAGITNNTATTSLNISTNTTPTTAEIVVNDTSGSGTDKLISLQASSTPKFTVDAAGNVVALGGLTAGSSGQFTVSSSGAVQAASLTTSGNLTTTNFFNVDTTNSKVIIGTGSATATPVVLGLGNGNSTDPTGFAGAMYYNSSTGTFRCYSSTWADCNSGSLYATTADSTTLNGATTGNQNFSTSYTMPANYCTAGHVIHVYATGIHTTGGTAQPMTFVVHLGATTITSTPSSISPNSSLTDVPWTLDLTFTCRAAPSASSAVMAGGSYSVQANVTTPTTILLGPATNAGVNVATNASQVITIGLTYAGSASASNTATIKQMVVTSE